MPRYCRGVVILSGAALAGPGGWSVGLGRLAHTGALGYERLTYDEALGHWSAGHGRQRFRSRPRTDLIMHVFDIAATGAMRQICEDADLGTCMSSSG